MPNVMKFIANPYIQSIIILLVSIIISIIVRFSLKLILKPLTKISKNFVDDIIVNKINRPVYITIILIGIIYALIPLGLTIKTNYYLDSIISTLIALIWANALIKISTHLVRDRIQSIADKTGLSTSLIPLISNSFRIAIIIGFLMVCFGIWKIDLTPLLASAGIASIVIAMAAKDTIANFFGGISIFFDKPYKVGNYILLDQQERGNVVDIGIRSTRIQTLDNNLVTIPNALIANSKIVNESTLQTNFNVTVHVHVAYGTDIELVENTLLEIAATTENLVLEHTPVVRFIRFAESSLEFDLYCRVVDPGTKDLIIHEINKKIYKRFIELGIKMPFPQRELYINTNK